MFSGITRGLFPVVHVEREPSLLRYEVNLGELAKGVTLGASISIDGVCQTAVAIEEGRVRFDAIEETLRLTTIGALEVGSLVSVERSLCAGDEIGGHEVSGHIRGLGSVRELKADGHEVDLRIAVEPAWMRYIFSKGFVALNGSSLTVGATDSESFWVHLIPETLERTNLGMLGVGSKINVELDSKTVAIVDTTERVLAEMKRRGELG